MRRDFAMVVIAGALIALACSDRPTSPSAPPAQAAFPQRVELVHGQPVTVPGTSLQMTLRLAPLWLYPICPAGPPAVLCGPEGPGVYLDASVPGRRESFDLMADTRPSRAFDRYEIRLESISPEPPLYATPAESGYIVRLLVTPAIAAP